MAIPTQTDAFRITLDLLSDGKEYTRKEAFAKAKTELKITPEEEAEKLSSGGSVYAGRIDWSIAYLHRGGLLERVSRGVYRISDFGKEIAATDMCGTEFSHWLDKRIKETNPWNLGADSKAKKEEAVEIEDASPEEVIERAAAQLNEDLSSQLIDMIMDRDPDFFERLVVDLLEKMGYGTGVVTQHSNDGGIDGLITTDELGFRPIVTQAKRYKADNVIGRPTVQSFVGALNGATNGVFITTSRFTQEAMDYARNYPNATLSLIDGKRLTGLMIKYGLGVATVQTIEIKRIDSDYFEG